MQQPERVAIWAAVSSEEQVGPDLPSLDEQIAGNLRYCQSEGEVVVAVLRAEGFSRFYPSLDRMVQECSQYAELVRLIRTHEITKVVCTRYNRLYRTLALAAAIHALAEENDVHLFSREQPLPRDAGPAALWSVAITGTMSEADIRNLIAAKRAGLARRAALGLPIMSRPFYGYRIEGYGRSRQMVINPEQAPAIVRIMELRAEGLGYKQIRARLASEGIRCPNSADGLWTQSALRHITHSPVYAGYIRYTQWLGPSRKHTQVDPETGKRTPPRRPGPPLLTPDGKLPKGIHQPIISEELWQAVCRINEAKVRDWQRWDRHTGPRLFVGFVRCDICGDAMCYTRTAYRKKRSAAANDNWTLCCAKYRRVGHSRAKRPDGCYYNPYDIALLRRQVVAWLQRVLADPESWARENQAPDERADRERRTVVLERERSTTERRQVRLMDAIETTESAQTRAEFLARYDDLGRRAAEIDAELAGLHQADQWIQRTQAQLQALADSIGWSQAAVDLEQWSDAQLRRLMRSLISRIYLRHGRPPRIIVIGQIAHHIGP